MTTSPVQVERRAAQRFGYQLPVSIRLADSSKEEVGFTQDLSARGVFLYTDCALELGARVDITLVMPAEVTLSENMRVRCQGKVLRINKPAAGSKTGVAVLLEHYEYLQEAAPAAVADGHAGPTATTPLGHRSSSLT